MMSATCFEPQGSSSGRLLYIQVWYSVFYMLKLPLKVFITYLSIKYFFGLYCLIERLRWSRGKRAGLWYPSTRVQTRPKPSDVQGEKILITPSFGGEVKPSVPCRTLPHVKDPKMAWKSSFRINLPDSILIYSSTLRYQDLSRRANVEVRDSEGWNV